MRHLVRHFTNTLTLVGAPRQVAQGAAGGPIPRAVLASQPERSATCRAAPSRRDWAILVLAGVVREGARPLRALPPPGRLAQRQNGSSQRECICEMAHLARSRMILLALRDVEGDGEGIFWFGIRRVRQDGFADRTAMHDSGRQRRG
jgi:hypothetical protein